ncbi:PREDICTED: uncharacterized protein At4g14450, chloroplastic-like [Lupinus angustifolius]|uniref:uncharacterized protein At4g14450, chloroplastic-like n=1 Tax=Lupinus angustifolius TaxID=3871 RepID=UPI00092E98F1|nr:PREDICTED: uncharacterized protein At4g14450, chloroplastic-like [Lupinus angustifolius]
MADSKQQHHPSRLQRRAPSSLQINREIKWNVAIPLLSPLASPPPLPMEVKPQEMKPKYVGAAEMEKVTVVFKMWQHPAAPFCYEPAPIVPLFVPV